MAQLHVFNLKDRHNRYIYNAAAAADDDADNNNKDDDDIDDDDIDDGDVYTQFITFDCRLHFQLDSAPHCTTKSETI